MFRHILVPLDGSRLAEAVMPAVAYLAERLGARVTLLHVVESHPPKDIHGERHLASASEARTYLEQLTARAGPGTARVACHVDDSPASDVAVAIAESARALATDLIVLCAHGWGGVRGWIYGGIAQQVVHGAVAPVMVVHPPASDPAHDFRCARVLVPLDGSAEHEGGLAVAKALARACSAELSLLGVVPTPATLSGVPATTARLLPGATSELLDLSERDIEAYLEDHVRRLRAAGVPARAETRRGDPASTIVSTARRSRSDVIVLGTHGKRGMHAFWSGSVAPRVSKSTYLPLLLVPLDPSAR